MPGPVRQKPLDPDQRRGRNFLIPINVMLRTAPTTRADEGGASCSAGLGGMECDGPPGATGSNVGPRAPLTPDQAGAGSLRGYRPWSVPVSKEDPSASRRFSAAGTRTTGPAGVGFWPRLPLMQAHRSSTSSRRTPSSCRSGFEGAQLRSAAQCGWATSRPSTRSRHG